jgi:DNA-binding MarR family transcriptional regulator
LDIKLSLQQYSTTVSRHPLPFDPIDEAVRNWRAAGWDDSADGMALVTSVMRVHQLLLSRIDAVLEPLGLTFARFEVLMLLRFSRTGRLPLGKIGRRLQVHPASVTNAIDRLEAQGLVTRDEHPTDRRTTLAAITPDGRSLVEIAVTALNEQVFSTLAAPDVVDSLAALRRDSGDFSEPPASEPPAS